MNKIFWFFCLILSYPVPVMPDAVPTPTQTGSNIRKLENTKDSSSDQFVNPVVFSTHIPGNPNDGNDWLESIALDSSDQAFVLKKTYSELVHLDSDGNTKSTVSLIKTDYDSRFKWSGIAIDKNDNFYFIEDKPICKVLKYDKSMKLISAWSESMSKGISFDGYFRSLKTDRGGFLWLLRKDFKITKFDTNLLPVQTIELIPKVSWSYPTTFYPMDFVFDSDGYIFILTLEGLIFKFNPKGECLGFFSGPGLKSGRLAHPLAIAIDSEDSFYVSNAVNARIEKFNKTGDFITQWHVDGHLLEKGLTVDRNDNLWVLAVNNVLKFSKNSLEKDVKFFTNEIKVEDKKLPFRSLFTLDEKGEICPDFWKSSPYPPWFGENKLTVIKAPQSLVPFAKSIGEAKLPLDRILRYDPADDDSKDDETVEDTNYTKKDFMGFKNDIKTLGGYGFDLSDNNVGAAMDLEIYKKTDWGYLWGFFNCLYFIPGNQPNKAFLIENEWLGVDDIEVEALGKDCYRFFIWYRGAGRGDKSMFNVYDLDLINLKMSKGTGNQALDLKNGGHYSIIDDFPVAETILWPWIFSWKDGKWVDTSADFPDFYKTQGVNIVENSGMNTQNQTENEHKVLTALKNAALKGGPAAFGQ